MAKALGVVMYGAIWGYVAHLVAGWPGVALLVAYVAFGWLLTALLESAP